MIFNKRDVELSLGDRVTIKAVSYQIVKAIIARVFIVAWAPEAYLRIGY